VIVVIAATVVIAHAVTVKIAPAVTLMIIATLVGETDHGTPVFPSPQKLPLRCQRRAED
jgi:hypothetical protein